jgi:Fe-S cluster biogenesis protein NfuA
MSEAELLTRVRQVVEADVLPALAMDGTMVEVVGVDAGIVQVRLSGACGSCPSSVRAVVMGIEEELLKRVPEVRYLETVG